MICFKKNKIDELEIYVIMLYEDVINLIKNVKKNI